MSFGMPKRIWIEMHDPVDRDACDVIVEMEDGSYYTALFVTLPYLRRQMELTYEMCKQLPDTPHVHFATMETPHILVESLDRDTIEDTIDNLIALDTFESLFNVVIQDEDEAPPDQRVRTAEVAAVVLNDVLKVEPDTTVA